MGIWEVWALGKFAHGYLLVDGHLASLSNLHDAFSKLLLCGGVGGDIRVQLGFRHSLRAEVG